MFCLLAAQQCGEKRDEETQIAYREQPPGTVVQEKRFHKIIAIAGLVMLAFAWRVVILAGKDLSLYSDGVILASLGKNLASGHGYSSVGELEGLPHLMYPPLYPLFVAGLYRLTGQLAWSSRVVSALFGALLLMPAYLLGKRLYSTGVGITAAALVATFPSLVEISSESLTEATYLFWLYWGLVVAWYALERKRPLWHFSAGVLLGIAYLTRLNGIFHFILVVLWAMFANLRAPQLRWRKTTVSVAALMIGFLLVASPYLAFVHRHTGRWSFSGTPGFAFLYAKAYATHTTQYFASLDDEGTEVRYKEWEKDFHLLSYLIEHHPTFFRLVFSNIRTYALSLAQTWVFPTFLWLLVGLGLFGTWWDRARLKSEAYLFSQFLPFLGFNLFTVPYERYMIPLMPVLLLWTAKGIGEVESWLKETADHLISSRAHAKLSKVPYILLVVLAAFLALHSVPEICIAKMPEYQEVGLWMKEHLTPVGVVMSVPDVAFYAGGRQLPFPADTYERVLRYARLHRADYAVVGARFMRSLGPALEFLLDEHQTPPGLKLIYVQADPPERKMVVYQIRY